jgi:hypothetical protein
MQVIKVNFFSWSLNSFGNLWPLKNHHMVVILFKIILLVYSSPLVHR